MSDLRFPIGKFTPMPNATAEDCARFIRQIAEAPKNFRAAVHGLSDEQLETPYRPDGWTLRQVVHHIPDSHMNAYIRSKLAVTEEGPTIKPYHEALWAELADARSAPIEPSLRLFESLHERWVIFLNSLQPADFAKPMLHPERGPMTIDSQVQLYAWHGRHHAAHITTTRERMGW
jgi:uncharacterized damage-inducible protein DinB